MKYRLKDKEIQAKLDEVSHGSLTKMLESDLLNLSGRDEDKLVPIFFGEFFVQDGELCPQFCIHVQVRDMEEIKEQP